MHVQRIPLRPRYYWLCLLISAIVASVSVAQPTFVSPLPQSAHYRWFVNHSWGRPDAAYAGPYVMRAVGDALYLGFSAAVPTHDHNGALLASYRPNGGLALIAPLDEQDVNRIKRMGTRLLIPGYDPANGDGWDAGNLYIYDTASASFNKLRYADATPRLLASTTTDADGHYAFEGLLPSSYLLRFISPPGYRFTQAQRGPQQLDSNPDADGWDTTCSARHERADFSGQTIDLSADAGLIERAGAPAGLASSSPPADLPYRAADDAAASLTLGDRVWLDANANGQQDDAERGVAGVRVELHTRRPYFPCMVHGNGVYGDAETNTIYYAGGSNSSQLYISTDGGASWALRGQPPGMWSQDLTRHNGYLYRLQRIGGRAAAYTVTYITYSADGETWHYLQPPPPQNGVSIPHTFDPTNAFVTFQGALLVLHASGDYLYRITAAGDYALLPISGARFSGILPEFADPDARPGVPNADLGITNHYNTLANANDELLYAIGDDNALYASANLRGWQRVADFNGIGTGAALITLAYWPQRGQVVAATVGAEGALYAIDHAAVLALFR